MFRYLEVENKGPFAFEWYLVNQENMFSPLDDLSKLPETPSKGEKPKPGKPKLQAKSVEKLLGATHGPFRIFPVRGQLESKSKMQVQVDYNAQGDAPHALNLALLVSLTKEFLGMLKGTSLRTRLCGGKYALLPFALKTSSVRAQPNVFR